MLLTRKDLASMIDHSLLRPNATLRELEKLCEEAAEYGFKAVCVNPIHVEAASGLLRGKGVFVCSVVGFPLGTHSAEIKAAEAREVVRLGAQEIDMVIHVGALKDGRHGQVRDEIRAVVEASEGRPVKVILETCYLTDEEKIRGCELALEAGASFVKTSTGFAAGGAKVEDVRLMRRVVGSRGGVKAAGGIRTLEDALKMIEAGASRLGTSSSVAILREMIRSE
jgi:deoxyribose-phosphate aldolase